MSRMAASGAEMKALGIAALVVALATSNLYAAAPEAGTVTAPSASTAQQNKHMYRSSKIIGTAVRDMHDRKIGEIKDLLLDSRRGAVAFAIVNFGGVLGVGSKYHAIPWQILRPSDDARYYVLQADRETISLAPSFDRGNWPDLSDERWSADVERYWSRRLGPGSADANRLPEGPAAAPGSR